jgi:lysophospholipase L1-like esterase
MANVNCLSSNCKWRPDGLCVYYNGLDIPAYQISNGDNLNVVITKLVAAIGSGSGNASETPNQAVSTNTLTLSATGAFNRVISGSVKRDPQGNNRLVANSNGLYVAPISSSYGYDGDTGILVLTIDGTPLTIPLGVTAVTSVFGRTGDVVAETGDYNFTDIGNRPTTLAGYEITDPVVLTSTNYADPSWITSLAKSKVGLGNADDTSDASKPISTATQLALDLKAPLTSPTFFGIPAVPTATPGTNTTQAASTAFVTAAVASATTGVSSFNARTGAVVAATNDYSWAQIDKTTSSLGDLTTRSATDLTSGTLPIARLPSNVPLLDVNNTFTGTITYSVLAGSGTRFVKASSVGLLSAAAISSADVGLGNVPNVDATNASNISTGTLSDARLSGNVPLLNATNTFTANQTINGGLTVSGAITNTALTSSIAAKAPIASPAFTGTVFLGQGVNLETYNTVDQTTNYERLRLSWSGNVALIASQAGGTGVARTISIGGSFPLTIGATGVVTVPNTLNVNIINSTGTNTPITLAGGVNFTQSTGLGLITNIFGTVNQTGTASYTAFRISPYEQAVGSGTKKLIDAGTNAAANGGGVHTSKFSVNNAGTIFSAALAGVGNRNLLADSSGNVSAASSESLATGLAASSGLLIGDSETGTHTGGLNGLDTYLLTTNDTDNGTTITNQAVSGNTITQQQTIWTADANKATYDWIVIMIGLNDIWNYSGDTAAQALTRLQTFINTINSGKKATAKTILVAMLPIKQAYIDAYGTTNGATAQAKWVAVNDGIMGNGANKITGVDYRVNEHIDLFSDGDGNLASVYNSGDNIHYNNLGRRIMASIYRKILNKAGFLSNVQPRLADKYWFDNDTAYLQPTHPYLVTPGRVGIGITSGLIGRLHVTDTASTAATTAAWFTGTNTVSSGIYTSVAITPTYIHSGSAARNAVYISPYIQSAGSGNGFLLRAGINTAPNSGGTHTDRFTVSEAGDITHTGNILTTGNNWINGSPVGAGSKLFVNDTSSTPGRAFMWVTGTSSASSGIQSALALTPTWNETGTAGNNSLFISAYSQSEGSGLRYLIRAGSNSAADGSGTHTDKFTVSKNGRVVVGAATTSNSSLNIPVGVAPAVPTDGDIWYDGTNLRMRIGGTTKTFTLT